MQQYTDKAPKMLPPGSIVGALYHKL